MNEVIIDGVRYIPEQKLTASCWYMHDNFTFSKLKGSTIDEIIEQAEKAKSPYGMLCPISILQGDREIRKVGTHCHDGGRDNPEKWIENLKAWRQSVEKDLEIHRILANEA